MQVLLPDGHDHEAFAAGTGQLRRLQIRFPVVYVLPTGPHANDSCGDGLSEIQRLDLHNKYQMICVVPTFSHVPWFANHATDPTIQQETYLLRSILPFIDHEYPIDTKRRYVVGLGKSGWGAYSLLLRNPDRFAKAVAWDSPLGQQTPFKYGMIEVFDSQENFERYDIWDLLEARAELLRLSAARFGLMGFGDYRAHHQATHHHMTRLRIPHAYLDGPKREHTWCSGWLDSALEFLVDADRQAKTKVE